MEYSNHFSGQIQISEDLHQGCMASKKDLVTRAAALLLSLLVTNLIINMYVLLECSDYSWQVEGVECLV